MAPGPGGLRGREGGRVQFSGGTPTPAVWAGGSRGGGGGGIQNFSGLGGIFELPVSFWAFGMCTSRGVKRGTWLKILYPSPQRPNNFPGTTGAQIGCSSLSTVEGGGWGGVRGPEGGGFLRGRGASPTRMTPPWSEG